MERGAPFVFAEWQRIAVLSRRTSVMNDMPMRRGSSLAVHDVHALKTAGGPPAIDHDHSE
jgi:hypothetical protein